MNYDSSEVGTPYCRVSRITINYPDNSQSPSLTIEQCLAVKLKDGTVRQLEELEPISAPIDMAKMAEPIPLVHPETSANIGQNTTLQQVFMCVLAYVRNEQRKAQQ